MNFHENFHVKIIIVLYIIDMECQYCHKSFSNGYVLKNHQKTTKSCIRIQKETGVIREESEQSCSYCLRSYSTKYNLDCHLKTCKKKIKSEQELKEKQLQDLLVKNLETDMLSYDIKRKQDEFEHKLLQKEL